MIYWKYNPGIFSFNGYTCWRRPFAEWVQIFNAPTQVTCALFCGLTVINCRCLFLYVSSHCLADNCRLVFLVFLVLSAVFLPFQQMYYHYHALDMTAAECHMFAISFDTCGKEPELLTKSLQAISLLFFVCLSYCWGNLHMCSFKTGSGSDVKRYISLLIAWHLCLSHAEFGLS